MTSPPPRLAYPHSSPPPPGEVIEVVPGVFWLRMPLPFALDHINLWALADGEAWTLVDCGIGDATTRALWDRHFATTLAARPVRRIVVTHCHPDHLGNAAWLAARDGCPVAMTAAEFLTAHALAGEHGGLGIEPTIALFTSHGLAAEHLEALRGRGNAYRRGVPTLPAAFERLHDGDPVPVGDTTWTVITGHGHSPDHAALHSAARGVLIAGDMLLPRISTNVSVWPSEPDGDPLARFLASLARFAALPAHTLVLPSHGLPFRGIGLRVAELGAHHAARLAELEAAIAAAGPSSAASMLPVLFRRELDLQQRFFAMGEAVAHLNHLWRSGRLTRVRTEDNRILYAPLPDRPSTASERAA